MSKGKPKAVPEYIPDNPDGSGDSTTELQDRDGVTRAVPYHYEHLTAASTWEVVTVIPFTGETPAHLNTYQVPGDILADLLLEMWDDIHGEEVVSVRRLPEATA